VEVPIIAGGPYATSDYRQMLRDSNISLAVIGEGELTLACLVEKMLDNNKKLPPEDQLLKMRGIALIKEDERAILEQKRRKLITLDNRTGKLAGHSVENLENINNPEDLLYLISTSGSTGTPKSVMLEHRNLLNLLEFQFADSTLDFNHVLQFASIGFDVSAQEIFSTLLSGGKLFLIDSEKRHDIPWLFNYIRRNTIDTLFLPPAFLKFVFSEPEYAAIFPSSVKHIIAAGEQLVVPEPLRNYLKDNHVVLHNHYGPSETHVVSTLTIDPGGEIPALPSIGKPIANTGLYILDENKNLVPIGVPGELYISGDSVGRGYYNREQPTRERYMPDPFFQGERMYRTGDLARRLPDGNIEFLGRVDLQVKLRGYRIEPGEIETQLMNHQDVKEAVVAAGGQGHGHEYLCAYIVAAGPGKFDRTPSMAEELKNYLSRSLPGYMIPAHFVKMERLPLTPSGKIDRKALPEPGKGDGAAGDFIAPRDEIEMKLASLWAEVLGIEKSGIGIDGNFFGLGGHSLKATVMTAKIHREFMVRVPLSHMFSAPTIRKLAGYLKEAEKETTAWEDNHLVRLRKGSLARHLFLVHDGTGEIEGYIEFCRHLRSGMNCWGIQAERPVDYAPRNLTIEEISREYIRKIKKVQPRGPYYLAGWSIGGTIAFEVLRQLEKINEEVIFFAMIDSIPPPGYPYLQENGTEFSLRSELEWLGEFLENDKVREKAGKAVELDQLWRLIVDYLEEINLDVAIVRKLIPGNMGRGIPNSDRLTLRELIYYLNVIRTLSRARDHYIPGGKVKTPVHFFAAGSGKIEKEEGWREYCCDPLDIHEIEGDHFSIMEDTRAAVLAERFDRIIDLE
jgi:amino acid adenylation domain-containing protein